MRDRLLLFDVGNTSLKIGITRGDDLERTFSLPTDPKATVDSLGLALSGLCNHARVRPEEIEACVVCSVSPAVDRILGKACKEYFGQTVKAVSKDLIVPLENRYQRPAEVGADRLVSAYAARRTYDAHTIVSVDFGTATTFDCVQGDAYLGGLICPGLLSSAYGLFAHTAKLPQIRLDLDSPELQVGQSTHQSLNQGLIFGFAAMCEGLCVRLRETLVTDAVADKSFFVVGNGGFAEKIGNVANCFNEICPELLLLGLILLYRETGSRV